MNQTLPFISAASVILWMASLTAWSEDTLDNATHYLQTDNTEIEMPNTRSPNGKFALFTFSLEGSTAAMVGIVTIEHKECLALPAVRPYGSGIEDRKSRSYLTVLWSSDSKRIAIHDSIKKHSLLEVYTLTDGVYKKTDISVAIDDAISTSTFPESPASSGQVPRKWSDDNNLTVEFRAKTKSGEQHSEMISIALKDKVVEEKKEDLDTKK